MVLVDTPVMVYAAGGPHPLRQPCVRLLMAQGLGRLDGVTTIQVIQQFAHIRSRGCPRSDAVALAREYSRLFRLVDTTRGEFALGLSLYERFPGLGAFDAVLAAVALSRRMDALISADRGFAQVPGLPWVDPASPDMERFLNR